MYPEPDHIRHETYRATTLQPPAQAKLVDCDAEDSWHDPSYSVDYPFPHLHARHDDPLPAGFAHQPKSAWAEAHLHSHAHAPPCSAAQTKP